MWVALPYLTVDESVKLLPETVVVVWLVTFFKGLREV